MTGSEGCPSPLSSKSWLVTHIPLGGSQGQFKVDTPVTDVAWPLSKRSRRRAVRRPKDRVAAAMFGPSSRVLIRPIEMFLNVAITRAPAPVRTWEASLA